MPVKHIIEIEGVPRIAETRLAVSEIVLWHEQSGWDVEKIAQEFDLTLGQVYAALSYYYDHREQIQAFIAAEKEWTQTARSKYLTE